MKNIFNIFLAFVVLNLTYLYGQISKSHDFANMRDGEDIEFCLQHKKMAELMKNPAYANSIAQGELEFKKALQKGTPKGIVYKIPIVFHILHNGGVENISDEQVFDQVAILNRDFRRLNADAATVHSSFTGMPSDVEVEFVLATKAPNGACFKGITRTKNILTNDGSDNDAQISAIKAGNDVYQGDWPGNKYLNVYVCANANGAAGYTYNPTDFWATSMSNGIWILHDYVGAIGTGTELRSRAFTHEVGHWLNLSHTWGSNNNPGNASSCDTDDDVTDTPNCVGVTSCNILANTCIDAVNDKIDNVENYMDYSYCSKMFTQGQVDRMRAALQVQSTGRFNLWQSSNLAATGANGVTTICKAEFSANRTSICLGEEVQFTDDSYNAVSGWSWEITPSTGWNFSASSSATSQNPKVIFTQTGSYTIKLTATDGTSSKVATKLDYIKVMPASSSTPYWEGFETYTALNNLNNWEVYSNNNNNVWTIESTVGHSGTRSAKLINFGQVGPNVDELSSAPIDLSVIPSTGSVTLSFRYSYRKRNATDNEYLKVFISNDCGATWTQRKTLGGSGLSALMSATSWKPSLQADWVTVHMTNVTNPYFVQNFRMKFRFEGNGGNNIYLDDINLYPGGPSGTLVLGLDENNEETFFNYYPIPAEDELTVEFNSVRPEKIVFEVSDFTGKMSDKQTIQANEGNNLVLFDTSKYASGVYLLKVIKGNSSNTVRFVVN